MAFSARNFVVRFVITPCINVPNFRKIGWILNAWCKINLIIVWMSTKMDRFVWYLTCWPNLYSKQSVLPPRSNIQTQFFNTGAKLTEKISQTSRAVPVLHETTNNRIHLYFVSQLFRFLKWINFEYTGQSSRWIWI